MIGQFCKDKVEASNISERLTVCASAKLLDGECRIHGHECQSIETVLLLVR